MHVVGTWALSAPLPSLSAFPLPVLSRAWWPRLLQEACQPGAHRKSAFGLQHVRLMGRCWRLSQSSLAQKITFGLCDSEMSSTHMPLRCSEAGPSPPGGRRLWGACVRVSTEPVHSWALRDHERKFHYVSSALRKGGLPLILCSRHS